MQLNDSSRLHKYISFFSMYIRCIGISFPLISCGAYIMASIMLYQNYCLLYGLFVSIIIQPMLFQSKRRSSQMQLDMLMIIISIIGLVLYNTQAVPYIFGVIGVVCGCSWASGQGYINEMAGWDDPNSAHLNNVPLIMILFGASVAFILFLLHIDSQLQLLLYFSLGITVSVGHLVVICTWMEDETPVYYMQRFEELRGRLLLQRLFRSEYVEYLENKHIRNNEKLNDLNRTYCALISAQFKQRTICSVVLNLCLWMTVMICPIEFDKDQKDELITPTDHWLMIYTSMALFFVILGGFGLQLMKTRISLIISTSIILFCNIILGVLFKMRGDEQETDVIYYLFLTFDALPKLLFFFMQLPKTQMYTFQALPDKGWGITTNFQWVGLGGAVYCWLFMNENLSQANSEEFFYVFLTYPIINLIQLIVLLGFCEEVQGLSEQQIQFKYSGKSQDF